MLWTPRQRSGLALVVGGVLLLLLIRLILSPTYVSRPQQERAVRAGEVVDRIDPNTADWPTLAALPVIGKSLAQRIVQEREAFRAEHPGGVAYRTGEDMLRVKGIGEATLAAIEPFLAFPAATPPAAQP